ncbi:MAG TPA: Wzz/FepE/Etk N-terminal domain-containing protein, partial [Bacteroidales bacterium]|nr:Wzz/FepE/Etk N-terminal domain-containing protein [Bacteroidales bacterium]
MHPISLENIISLIRRWKRVFLLTTLGAVMLSLAFSLPWMIPPRYRSTVVMYPTSTSSLSSSMLSDLQWSEEDLLEFGEREEANQLKQILVSEPIRDHLIVRYRLFEHYQIDTTDAHPLTRLWKEYERNVEVRINEYGAVELTVYDTD